MISAISRGLGWLSRAAGGALVGLVRAYQAVVSPWFAPTCRYYPSCSAYAVTALRMHGPIKGLLAAGWRLLRCNPWSAGGVDHVPEQWPRRRAVSENTRHTSRSIHQHRCAGPHAGY